MKARLILLCFVPLCALASALAGIRMLWSIAVAPERARILAVAFDELGNSAINGNTGETISSRAGRARRAGRRWGCILCGVLERLDPGHCDRNIQPEFEEVQ
jgi:hypothetical protein